MDEKIPLQKTVCFHDDCYYEISTENVEKLL